MKKINWTLALFSLLFILGMFIGTTESTYHGTRSVADFAGLIGSGIGYGLTGSIVGLLIDFFNKDLSKVAYQKRLIIVLASIVVVLTMIFGALLFTGYFGSKTSNANTGKNDSLENTQSIKTEPTIKNKNEVKRDESNNLQKHEKNYLQLDKELMASVSGSNKVLVVQVALMTHYDNRVFERVKKHEFVIRTAMLDVMRLVTEEHMKSPNFRRDLAAIFMSEINEILEKYEDFGGVEDVFFTSFVVQ